MNLEDHLGDIIRKARAMSNVAPEAAARASGLSAGDFAALEETGKANGKINFAELAPLIGLSAAKLEKIANGWTPGPKDLSPWRELRVFTTEGQGITVNCYLVWDEVSREAAIFDTGWDAALILKTIADEQLVLRHL